MESVSGQAARVSSEPRTRLAELIAALSLATGLGMGQQMELGLRMAALGVEIGRRLGLGAADLSDIYYLALVAHVGCTSDSLEFASFAGGDDIAFRRNAIKWPSSEPAEVLREILLYTGEGRSPLRRGRLVASMLIHGEERPRKVVAAHCEAGSRLAERLGLSTRVRTALAQEQERWDGKGLPDHLSGDALSIAKRVVSVAQDALVIAAAGGTAMDIVRRRRGRAYDPTVVDAFLDIGGLDALDPASDAWVVGLAAEPAPVASIGLGGIDRFALACADFTDLKSPYLLGHSTRVAEIAVAAADTGGYSSDDIVNVRRACLFHDLGRVGVPNGIWDKPGPLSANELERVRLHAYYTERVLARSPVLASLAVIAGSHHENLDGSGYHRAVSAPQLSRPARLLRAADCFDAMSSNRPHRPALSFDERLHQLRSEVGMGRLDADAVSAIIEASGGERVRLRPPRPAGLSEREVEVLRLLVHGLSNPEIGTRLHLSAKTVGHHVEHIYDKAGVTSRAAAALFAMETGIL